MIVIANEEFATGLRLAGVKDSYPARSKEQIAGLLSSIPKNKFIIATKKAIDLYPKLSEYPNIIVFPDTLKDFSKIEDLNEITRTAIGAEVQL
jgi:vacuolar-type H+-ATPase subunit F/Vma7